MDTEHPFNVFFVLVFLGGGGDGRLIFGIVLFWEITHVCIVSGLLATFHRQHVRFRSIQPAKCNPTQQSQ